MALGPELRHPCVPERTTARLCDTTDSGLNGELTDDAFVFGQGRHYICAEVSYLYTASGGTAHRQLHSARRWLQGVLTTACRAKQDMAFLQLVNAPSVSQSLFLGLAHRCKAGEPHHQGEDAGGAGARE